MENLFRSGQLYREVYAAVSSCNPNISISDIDPNAHNPNIMREAYIENFIDELSRSITLTIVNIYETEGRTLDHDDFFYMIYSGLCREKIAESISFNRFEAMVVTEMYFKDISYNPFRGRLLEDVF
jgi:hypothetical protein